jgi:uncharacterized protein
MEMTGEQLIAASRETAWRALNDPAVLKDCIPGCDTIEKLSDTEFALGMTTAIGPIKAKFKGKLLLANVDAPNSYELSFEGQGGMAGFAKGGAKVNLEPSSDSETRLAYTVNASVGGKLAQVGSRLVDAAARKIAEEFFTRFRERVSIPDVDRQ